jgi:hypothetical protein
LPPELVAVVVELVELVPTAQARALQQLAATAGPGSTTAQSLEMTLVMLGGLLEEVREEQAMTQARPKQSAVKVAVVTRVCALTETALMA